LLHLFLDVIDAESVGDEFDDATIGACRKNFIGSKFELKLALLEYEIDGFNQLHGKLLRA